jgi:hypothetical protein
LLLALLLTAGISYRHMSWQKPTEGVLKAVARVAAAAGTKELALTYSASKIGILYPGPLRRFVPGTTRAKVVLCAEASPSYRREDLKSNCAFPGYHLAAAHNGFQVLVREADAASDGGPGSR